MGGRSGCETTASRGLSPLLTSQLSHRSRGGNSFTAETFVNDDRESGRRLRRWPERPSLTKVSAMKHAPPCETMDHTRPFQLSLVSRRCGPRLLPENRPGRMLYDVAERVGRGGLTFIAELIRHCARNSLAGRLEAVLAAR